jgi:hypothetical protein
MGDAGKRKPVKDVVAFWAISAAIAAVPLCLFGGIAFVMVHFIVKFW